MVDILTKNVFYRIILKLHNNIQVLVHFHDKGTWLCMCIQYDGQVAYINLEAICIWYLLHVLGQRKAFRIKIDCVEVNQLLREFLESKLTVLKFNS